MINEITLDNYEAYYLDYLEGNLDDTTIAAFEAFLEAHPSLKMDDEELPMLELSNEQLSSFEKSVLYKGETFIHKENLSIFLIAELENQLSAEQLVVLNNYLANNEYARKEKAWFQQTILPTTTIEFSAKSGMKKGGRIVPLYWLSGAAAASIALFITFNSFKTVPSSGIDLDTNGQTVAKVGDSTISSSDSATSIDADVLQPTSKQNLITPIASTHSNEQEKPVELEKKQFNWKNTDKQLLLPIQKASNESTADIPKTKEENNGTDLAMLTMTNPVKSITNKLSEKLNTEIDFKSAKPTERQKGGFYLKIGKLEITRQKSK